MPRLIILLTYPLLFAASALAAYQARKLAKNLPSRAWDTKRNIMILFMLFQIFGLVKGLWVPRVFNWIDIVYLLGVLALILGLNYFDYLLLQDDKHLRRKIISMTPKMVVSGDMPADFWQKEFRAAVRDSIKDEYLKPKEDVNAA